MSEKFSKNEGNSLKIEKVLKEILKNKDIPLQKLKKLFENKESEKNSLELRKILPKNVENLSKFHQMVLVFLKNFTFSLTVYKRHNPLNPIKMIENLQNSTLKS